MCGLRGIDEFLDLPNELQKATLNVLVNWLYNMFPDEIIRGLPYIFALADLDDLDEEKKDGVNE